MSAPSGEPAGRLDAVRRLVEAASTPSAELADLLRTVFPTIGAVTAADPANQRPGEEGSTAQRASAGALSCPHPSTPGVSSFSALAGASAVWHDTALFAISSHVAPTFAVDDAPPEPMTNVAGTTYWFGMRRIEPGRTHAVVYAIGGQVIAATDVAGYQPGSYELAGVPRGTFSDAQQVTSQIYPGAVTTYRVYTNVGVDTDRGAPVMVWHDGDSFAAESDFTGHRLRIVSDNLVHQGLIPPMAHILVSPSQPGQPLAEQYEGQPQAGAMRSLQYDSVSDRYGRHLLDEVLPAAGRLCRLREDGYSRGSGGLSSGGICAFKLAWFQPEHFSRVHCGIGSFTGLQWHPDEHIDGGFIFPYLVRRGPRRNIRVWLSDGANDIEVDHHGRADLFAAGSWPLASLAMAQALKTTHYDFRFRYGTAGHNGAQTALDLPESLAWLWRDYDPDRTHQDFEPEAAERALPVYRFGITNR